MLFKKVLKKGIIMATLIMSMIGITACSSTSGSDKIDINKVFYMG